MQAEADRITNEIQKKKEKEMRDWEQNRAKLMVICNIRARVGFFRTGSFGLTYVCVSCHSASAIIWVHVLYLKLL